MMARTCPVTRGSDFAGYANQNRIGADNTHFLSLLTAAASNLRPTGESGARSFGCRSSSDQSSLVQLRNDAGLAVDIVRT
jgi:hypothetical protein